MTTEQRKTKAVNQARQLLLDAASKLIEVGAKPFEATPEGQLLGKIGVSYSLAREILWPSPQCAHCGKSCTDEHSNACGEPLCEACFERTHCGCGAELSEAGFCGRCQA